MQPRDILISLMTQFVKISIPDAYLGSEYTSDLAINSMIRSKDIEYKVKGCRENMKKVYKNYLIF